MNEIGNNEVNNQIDMTDNNMSNTQYQSTKGTGSKKPLIIGLIVAAVAIITGIALLLVFLFNGSESVVEKFYNNSKESEIVYVEIVMESEELGEVTMEMQLYDKDSYYLDADLGLFSFSFSCIDGEGKIEMFGEEEESDCEDLEDDYDVDDTSSAFMDQFTSSLIDIDDFEEVDGEYVLDIVKTLDENELYDIFSDNDLLSDLDNIEVAELFVVSETEGGLYFEYGKGDTMLITIIYDTVIPMSEIE